MSTRDICKELSVCAYACHATMSLYVTLTDRRTDEKYTFKYDAHRFRYPALAMEHAVEDLKSQWAGN